MLNKWINENFLSRAGFISYERFDFSHPVIISRSGHETQKIYVGRISRVETPLNLMIIEREITRKGKTSAEWYFKTFEEPEDIREYNETNLKTIERSMVNDENKIDITELEYEIFRILNPTSTFERFVPN